MKGPCISDECFPEGECCVGWCVQEWPISFGCVDGAKEEVLLVVSLPECSGVEVSSTIVDEFGKGCYLEILPHRVENAFVFG